MDFFNAFERKASSKYPCQALPKTFRMLREILCITDPCAGTAHPPGFQVKTYVIETVSLIRFSSCTACLVS